MNGTLIALVGFALVFVSEPALALRPYDSTDADVAKQGEFELELGPVGWRREGSKRIAVVPAVIGNFGLEGNRELVIQGSARWRSTASLASRAAPSSTTESSSSRCCGGARCRTVRVRASQRNTASCFPRYTARRGLDSPSPHRIPAHRNGVCASQRGSRVDARTRARPFLAPS